MNYNGVEHDEHKPLDVLTIPCTQSGVLKQIPALHVMWVQSRCYLHYTPPPQQQPDGSFLVGAKQDWLDSMKCILEDLEWLLHLEQYRFWSQIVHDEGAMDMIVSFLQEGYPHYMIHEFPRDDDMWRMYRRIYQLVLLVIIRLSTHTESESAYMTPSLLGKLIYNNYIFSICIILDLCLLYGRENHKLLAQVVNTVFEVQPQYQNDLGKSVGCMTQVLLGISAQLDVPMEATGEFLGRLKSSRNRLTLEGFGDLISHTLDSVMSLSSLLDIYTPSCITYHQQHFELRIVSFYENTLPEFYRKLEIFANSDDTNEVYASWKKKLDMTRVELLKAFRYILSSSINDVLVKKDRLSTEETKAAVDDYVHVLTECLGDRRFVRDYHTKYPLDYDLDMLAQLCPEMDKLKSDYLLESALASFDVPPIKKPKPMNMKPTKKSTASSEAVKEVTTVKKQKISGIKLQSLISQVKDLLPHLGDGFVESCLEYYDYSSDGVVNAVLENQLSPELQAMDYTMPRISAEEDETNDVDGFEGEQEEYVDDDESDKIDYSNSHRGKRKGQYRDLRDMMKDKSHREELREQYSQLGYVDTVYDDEYDDTYDHLDVSVQDDGDLERRPMVVPRVLRQKEDSESSGGEYVDGDEGEEEGESGPPRDLFVPNPEEMRAKAEQRRLAHQHNKPKSRNVVGQPKGHGQEKQVVLNRNNKTANKAFRGNHNRRAGAQRKRNQGMLPS